jgi:hypothetical protein
MARIVTFRRHGIQVYRATIAAGRIYREAVFMSEGGARDWLSRTLKQLANAVTAA